MNADRLISEFTSLTALSDEMRIAADHSEWDKLITLEKTYNEQMHKLSALIDALTPADARTPQVVALIRKILQNDEDIRAHTKIWIDQLDNIIKSNRQEQRLNQAYGAV